MDEENKNGNSGGPENGGNKTNAYIAIGLAVAGAVALGVSFAGLGIYALIASMLFEIASMTFINLQKRKQDFKWLLYIKIATYAIFIASLLVFAGGTIWSTQE